MDISSSAMQDFALCPRKFLYRWRLGIVPKAYQSALELGTLFHLGCEVIVQGGTMAEAQQAMVKAYREAEEALISDSDERGFLEGGKDPRRVLSEMELDYAKAWAMLQEFWKNNPIDWEQYEVLSVDGRPMIEALFRVKIPGLGSHLRGQLDLVLRKRGTNEVWIYDYKTTSKAASARAKTNRIEVQPHLYRLLLTEYLRRNAPDKDLVVKGVRYFIIRKPGIKYCPNTKDSGGLNSYVERVHKWYNDPANADEGMAVSEIHFSGRPLTTELYLRLKEQSAASQAIPDLQRFYMVGNDSICGAFGGCRYLNLCGNAEVLWPSIVESHYKIDFREDSQGSPEEA